MIRIVGAVVAGYAGTGVCIFLTDQLFGLLIPGFRSSKMPPLYYFVLSLFFDTLYSIVGGYLCATVARTRSRAATWGLMAFGEAMGVGATISLWNTAPHWWSFALLLLYPPAVWFGASLRTRPARPMSAGIKADSGF